MSEEEFNQFISERLFTDVKPVMITDLINQFKCGPNKAKKAMYAYYKDTKNVKFQCIIMACYGDDKIKIINDIQNIENPDQLTDCFIYAFNPTESFNPINVPVDQYDYLLFKNPNKVNIELEVQNQTQTQKPAVRSKTIEIKSSGQSSPAAAPSKRAKTVPEEMAPKKETKKKDMGLKSTALLARMRKERADKEAQRLEELRKRKQEENAKKEEKIKSDPKRKAQMNELNQLFVNDEDLDDDDMMEIDTPIKIDSSAVESSSPKKPQVKKGVPATQTELEEILDTTAEESLLELSQEPSTTKTTEPVEEVTTYMDKDGYMVTKKNVVAAEKPKSNKRAPVSSLMNTSAKLAKKAQGRKKQGSIESFFKRS